MDSKKADLVIKYNLHWKNGPTSNTKNRENIVAVCASLASTRNLEKFKSYLLKNSGATGDDVKVSYIGNDDKEFPIESQEDFETALNYFREVARGGNIITLKLELIFYKNRSGILKRSVSSLNESSMIERIDDVLEAQENNNLNMTTEEPPQWFLKYMTEFKKEVVKEVTEAVLQLVTKVKTEKKKRNKVFSENSAFEITPISSTPDTSFSSVKKKTKSGKRLKASSDHAIPEKDTVKECKLDLKLAKLENKALKLKEKKAALQKRHTADLKHGTANIRSSNIEQNEIEDLMGAVPVGQHEITIPHMLGGEIFEQEWDVVNTGKQPWTSETELHYAWGSEALKPVKTTYPCPHLTCGKQGIVKVQLEVPKRQGTYESYWHFHHKGHRFGHWLGCKVVVEPSPVKSKVEKKPDVAETPKQTFPLVDYAAHSLKLLEMLKQEKANTSFSTNTVINKDNQSSESNISADSKTLDVNLDKDEKENLQKDIQDLGTNLANLSVQENEYIEVSSSSDTDNQSIVSITDSNASSNSDLTDEFVLIPMPKDEDATTTNNIKTEKVSEEDLESKEKDENNDKNKSEKNGNSSDSDSEHHSYVRVNDMIIPIPTIDSPLECSFKQEKEETKEQTQEANSLPKTNENVKQLEQKTLQDECTKQIKDEVQVKDLKVSEEKQENKENELSTPKDDSQPAKDTSAVTVEYAYILIEGRRVPVPKQFLRSDYLENAETARTQVVSETKENLVQDCVKEEPKTPVNEQPPLPEKTETQKATQPAASQKIETITTNRTEARNLTSPYEYIQETGFTEVDSGRNTQSVYISAATTPDISLCSLQDASSSENMRGPQAAHFRTNYPNNTRLFVFPQNCPGFEVLDMSFGNEDSFNAYSNSQFQTNDTQSDSNAGGKGPWFSHYNTTGSSSSFYVPDPNGHFSCHQQAYSYPSSAYMNFSYNYAYPNGNQQHQHQHTYHSGNQQHQQQHQQAYHNGNVHNFQQYTYSNGNLYAQADPCYATAAAGNRNPSFSTNTEHSRPPANYFVLSNGNSTTSSTVSIASSDLREDKPRQASENYILLQNASPSHNPNDSEKVQTNEQGNLNGTKNNSFKGILPVSPENIVSGAVNVASSAINTARSVLNMFNPEPGRWVNGQWVSSDNESKRERGLQLLHEMGFQHRELNATLLARYNDDVVQVISELVQ